MLQKVLPLFTMKPKTRQTKESFLKKLRIKDSGCWDFKGAINATGYGVVGFNGKVMQAHRLSWFLHNGEIPDGLLVCHRCDNRRCCNPDHLFIGTHKDNTQDMILKGRRSALNAKRSTCRRMGHNTSSPDSRYSSGKCIMCCKHDYLIRKNIKSRCSL